MIQKNFFYSIRNRFRFFILFTVVVTISLAFIVILYELENISRNVSINYAKVYTDSFVKEIESTIGSEILLTRRMVQTTSIIDWMMQDDNNDLKKIAFQDLRQFSELYRDNNIFLASEATKHFYLVDKNTSVSQFVSLGTLTEENSDDVWYFETKKIVSPYQLNVDVDRFLGTMRVWINMKVFNQDREFVGIMGTGIFLDPLLNRVFAEHESKGAKALIINEFGAIQLSSDKNLIKQNSFALEETTEKTIYEFLPKDGTSNAVKDYLKFGKDITVLELNDDQYQFLILSPIRDTNWYVATLYNSHSLYAVNNLFPFLMILLGIILAFTIMLNIIVNKLFMNPFELLNKSIMQKEFTHSSTLYGIDRKDEFGTLAQSIQQMNDRMVQSVPVGMFLLSSKGDLLYANPYFLTQFDCPSLRFLQELLKRDFSFVFRHRMDYNEYVQQLKKSEDAYRFEFELYTINRVPFWAEVYLTKIQMKNNQWQYEGILINVQQKKDYEQSLVNLASTDRLTGLRNRLYFDLIVEEEMLRSDRYNHPITLILFDLDNFKRVNDLYGHDIGDQVLINTSNIVRENIRKTDVLARWGGEEIAILMPETDKFGAMIVAEKIRIALEHYEHEKAGVVTSSFGVAERSPLEPYSDWFKRVDHCVFESKSKGRNQISLASDPEIMKQSFVRLVWQPSFNSGNHVIDQEHIKLFTLTNSFLESTMRKNNLDHQLALFTEIFNHLQTHFKNEEQILQEVNFPEDQLHIHVLQHQKLLLECQRLHNDLTHKVSVASEVFTTILNDIIVGHLIYEDSNFFPYM